MKIRVYLEPTCKTLYTMYGINLLKMRINNCEPDEDITSVNKRKNNLLEPKRKITERYGLGVCRDEPIKCLTFFSFI